VNSNTIKTKTTLTRHQRAL